MGLSHQVVIYIVMLTVPACRLTARRPMFWHTVEGVRKAVGTRVSPGKRLYKKPSFFWKGRQMVGSGGS
jgi:hypothetical protein